jgi:hypothetical protein
MLPPERTQALLYHRAIGFNDPKLGERCGSLDRTFAWLRVPLCETICHFFNQAGDSAIASTADPISMKYYSPALLTTCNKRKEYELSVFFYISILE